MNIHMVRNVMGITPQTSINNIMKRYKELLLERHPDTGGTHELFLQLKEAYDCICNYEAPLLSEETYSSDDYSEDEEAIIVDSETESSASFTFESSQSSSDSDDNDKEKERLRRDLKRTLGEINDVRRENERLRKQMRH